MCHVPGHQDLQARPAPSVSDVNREDVYARYGKFIRFDRDVPDKIPLLLICPQRKPVISTCEDHLKSHAGLT